MITDKYLILEDLLENFNFVRVHEVMKILNWTWWQGGKNEVPSIHQLELQVIDLFNSVWKGLVEDGEEDYSCATGGLKVSGFKTNDNINEKWYTPYAFTVEFILEESSNY